MDPSTAAHRRSSTCVARVRLGVGAAALALGVATAAEAWSASTAGSATRSATDGAKSQPVRYGRDVRRILSDRCFQCHGADPASREAGLRLDLREGATGGKFPAIVPGDAENSELWWRITSKDRHEVMPPPGAKKRPLTEEERSILYRWIEGGAEYEPHWAFVPPERPAVPQPTGATWPRNEIDRFVLAGLESHGVEPAPEADRETLLRRVFLDLTGLPPTVDELDAFLTDDSPDAYEKVVDRLLGDEPYRSRLGEWLATSWMDAARYADTIGIHTDNGRQMWLWREWVMKAFRDNMPYDRFVTEQLAGDLLPEASLSAQVASGFNRNHVITDEGGAISDEYLVEYAVDRVSTTSAVFLGLTAGCARCHDHKYDPLTQEDFYGLMGFFNSVDEPGLYSQTPNAERAYEPFVEVPTEEQASRLERIETEHAELVSALAAPLPGEDAELAAFVAQAPVDAGAEWSIPRVLAADSSDARVTLEVGADGTLTADGPIPSMEDYVVELESDAADLRLVLLEAFATPPPDGTDLPDGAGRAFHGNAVVSQITLEARPAQGLEGETSEWTIVPLSWAWSDHTQQNGDFEAPNVLHADARGWAADGNQSAGARNLLLLAADGFGFEGGTHLRVTIAFRSPYPEHSLARIRFRVAPLASPSTLPVILGRWYRAEPTEAPRSFDREVAYSTAYGPEEVERIDPAQAFEPPFAKWSFDRALTDGAVVPLSNGLGAKYMGRDIWSPDARSLKAYIGSDDGFALYLNGEEVLARRVDRGPALDQDEVTLDLRAGHNVLVYKIVNTGGPSGYAFRVEEDAAVLVGELASALIPAEAVPAEQQPQLQEAWKRRFFADYRALDDERVAKEKERAEILASVPRTMVMRELEEPRPSYVLMRGQYDQPDESRAIPRRTPAFLSPLPEDAPRNRLGLAEWLTAPDNALASRVAVNRFWQGLFGQGLVRTSEDFGLQGDWPTHPELLDWLAVEFRASGWDVHALLRSMVVSSTYRQSSRVRPELAERDPDNRWLARYPRRRLTAEQIRDHALYTSGLLVERFGGPSVKPYQPAGLWQEVSMLQSNTRFFEAGTGADLWRRSVYTYWKRAVPPPSLSTFDAPVRESCVIRRQSTNTPLQALVLWNDVQFVEAARSFALRALAESSDDAERITFLFRTATGRTPEAQESELLLEVLAETRARFLESEEDARALLGVGESAGSMPPGAEEPSGPVEDEPTREEPPLHEPAELAAWTLVANTVLNLHETLTQD